MKIIDKKNLIPDENILRRIIKKHPLRKNLDTCIHNLIIKKANKPKINLDKNNNVTLYLPESARNYKKSYFEYVLYHEFVHIIDRLNSDFKYTKNKRNALIDEEPDIVLEIWNLYIDSRLKKLDLFCLKNENISLKINGKSQILPNNIKSHLMASANFIQTCGIKNAKDVVKNIWGNPTQFLSYDDMIIYAKGKKIKIDKNL